MKNSSRIFLIVLSLILVQSMGIVAVADEPTVGVCRPGAAKYYKEQGIKIAQSLRADEQ